MASVRGSNHDTAGPPETRPDSDALRDLVREMAQTLGARFAFITECLGDPPTRARTLVLWAGDGFRPNREYDLSGTPCASVVEGTMHLELSGIREAFPEDSNLEEFGAEAYLGVPLRSPEGRVEGHLAFLHDVPLEETPQLRPILKFFASRAESELRYRHTLARLRTSERRLELLIEKCQELVCEVDHTGRLSYVSLNTEDVLGYSAEELLGRDVFELAGLLDCDVTDLGPGSEDLVSMAASGPYTQLRRVRHRDGQDRWLDIRAVVFEDEGSSRGLVVARDVTENMRHATELQASEQRYRTLFENAFDIISELDSEGRVIYVNRSLETVLGWRPEEVVGLPLLGAIDEEHQADVAERLADGSRARLDGTSRVRALNRKGEVRWLEFTLRSFTAADGEPHRVLIAHDITGRVQLEALIESENTQLERRVQERTKSLREANQKLRLLQRRLMETERLGAGEELAGAVAHSINNPLQALMGTLELAGESEQDPRRALDRALQLARRVRDVVDGSLNLFRRGALKPAHHAPQAVIDLVASELRQRARAARVELKCEVGDRLAPVEVDRTLFVAALISLAENALDAMPDGGCLTLRAESPIDRRFVRFSVQDTGPGIPDVLLERVTDPFFTTRGGGTGLGLAIAKSIVTGHQGRLILERAPGGGTLAAIELRALDL